MFDELMSERLIELVTEREAQLFPRSTTKDANKVQNAAWAAVTSLLQADFPTKGIDEKQVRTKWKNLKAAAKDANQQRKK